MAGLSQEIDEKWCVMGSLDHCTLGEGIGQTSIHIFMLIVFIVVGVRMVICDANILITWCSGASVSDPAIRKDWSRWTNIGEASCLNLIIYSSSNHRWAHPFKNDIVQTIGAVLAAFCTFGFLAAQYYMGRKSWSPAPEALPNHELGTSGIFRWARHPMYAVFVWFTVAIFVATLNWLAAVLWIPVIVFVRMRIPVEERILEDLFGEQYHEYRQRVGMLGPIPCQRKTQSSLSSQEV